MPTRRRLLELSGIAATWTALWVAYHGYTAIASRIPRLTSMQELARVAPYLQSATVQALLWALLTPAIVAAVRRAPIAAPHRARNTLLLGLAIPLFASAHAALFTLLAGPATLAQAKSMAITPNPITATLAVLLAHLVIARAQAAERERKRLELAAMLTRAQTERLRTSLTPAFLFTTLEEIGRSVDDDPREAERLLVLLSELLRGAMDLLHEERVELAEELELADRYVELQRRGTLVLQAGDEALRALVPPFAVQTVLGALAPAAAEPVSVRAWRDDVLRLEFRTTLRDSAEAARLAPLFDETQHDGLHFSGRMEFR